MVGVTRYEVGRIELIQFALSVLAWMATLLIFFLISPTWYSGALAGLVGVFVAPLFIEDPRQIEARLNIERREKEWSA